LPPRGILWVMLNGYHKNNISAHCWSQLTMSKFIPEIYWWQFTIFSIRPAQLRLPVHNAGKPYFYKCGTHKYASHRAHAVTHH